MVAALTQRRTAELTSLAPSAEPVESLLVFSDVHLGTDVDERTLAHELPRRRPDRIDRHLVALLDHYASLPPAGDRWRIVVAGDFVDLIGMSVVPQAHDRLVTEPTSEERAHGLGSAPDHVCIKLSRVATRHAEVFAALAAFLARGNAMTLVIGNHDAELHWDEARECFRDLLAARLPDGTTEAERAAFKARIDFTDWFFYRPGVAYIEHGHQYDPLCATENHLRPLHPVDSRRMTRGFCDVLLRGVVRPTHGMFEHGHDKMGVVDYLRFGVRLGLRGMLTLGMRFARAIRDLLHVRRQHMTPEGARLRRQHRRLIRAFAQRARLKLRRLRAIAALQAEPITRSVYGILGTLLVDRVALGGGAVVLLATCLALSIAWPMFLVAAAVVALAWWYVNRALSRMRDIAEADALLAERAPRLAALLPAAFVVMGHTHAPRAQPIDGGRATYFNTGSWSEEESASGDEIHVASRTHVVIEVRDGKPSAELRVWRDEGPIRWVG